MTLISAEKNHQPDTINGGEPDFTKDRQAYHMVRLSLRFEYIGPEGEIVAPTISLLDNNEQKYNMRRHIRSGIESPDRHTIGSWLNFAAMGIKEKRFTKTGEQFGPWLMFYFEIPKEVTELKLVFEDVAPIPISN